MLFIIESKCDSNLNPKFGTILGFKNEISHTTISQCDPKQNTDCVGLIKKIKILRNRTVA